MIIVLIVSIRTCVYLIVVHTIQMSITCNNVKYNRVLYLVTLSLSTTTKRVLMIELIIETENEELDRMVSFDSQGFYRWVSHFLMLTF